MARESERRGVPAPPVDSSIAAAPVRGKKAVASSADERPTGSGRAPAFAPRGSVSDDIKTWPDPWKGLIAKSVPAAVLWTYHELGADLTGIGRSADRSAFFRTLLGELRMPKGSSVFWPCAMPEEREGADCGLSRGNPVLFAAGAARLSPQVVIVFGERALADMGLTGHVKCFRQIVVEGKLLLLLPEVEDLLQNQGQRASSVSLLRAVFATIAFR